MHAAAANEAQHLAREELRHTAGHQGAHDRVADARRNGDAGLTQDVFAFPPAGDELSLETTQALEVIERTQLARSRAERSLNHGMLATSNILCSFGRKWRCAQRRQ